MVHEFGTLYFSLETFETVFTTIFCHVWNMLGFISGGVPCVLLALLLEETDSVDFGTSLVEGRQVTGKQV